MRPDRLGWEQRSGGRVGATFGMSRGNGYLASVIAKSDYQFDGRLGSTQDIVLAAGIDTSACVTGVLQTRVHSKSAFTATAIANIIVQNASLVAEEPDVVYLPATGVTPVATSTNITSTSAAPVLDVVAFAAPIGSMVRVILRWTQGATAAAAVQNLSVSVDLVLRPA